MKFLKDLRIHKMLKILYVYANEMQTYTVVVRRNFFLARLYGVKNFTISAFVF
jgi:hypothetical protein